MIFVVTEGPLFCHCRYTFADFASVYLACCGTGLGEGHPLSTMYMMQLSLVSWLLLWYRQQSFFWLKFYEITSILHKHVGYRQIQYD